jgi:hypothetical protein
VNIEFFSSDGDIVIFANKENPKVKVEGQLDTNCRENGTYLLEVDFNEGQIANALHYWLRDAESNQAIEEGFIENVITEG